MRALAALLVAAVVVMGATQAQAASLRPMTRLHGPVVYLRDLFEDAGRNADRALGPGPDPGGRIVVPAAQLDAIARQYAVAWHSVSSADRAVLEWPGKPLDKEAAVAAARAALQAAGAPLNSDIELPGFLPPMIPAETTPDCIVSQLDYDPRTGRFTAILTVSALGMSPIDTRITGSVVEMAEVPVAATRLLPEMILRPKDVRVARIRTGNLSAEVARSVDQIAGMELRRPVPAGEPLQVANLMRPPLVRRGSIVQIELTVGALSVTGQAIALDTGADGEQIRVQNASSHAQILAQVIGAGRVRVVPQAGTRGASDRAGTP
ncbi:MAG TPA: flagellar basal body P-ring formation chaperone FlgA [Rhodopila sp.]|nr:flagellar basal body P-ring formation chaperone FlgA [Rhodopila sp.]